MMITKIEYITLILILLFGLIIAIFDSVIWCIIICSLFIIGNIWGLKIIKLIDNWIKNNVNKNINISENNEKCKICSDNSCNRHQPSTIIKEIKVPKDFDNALQNLLEKLLDTYVCTWYTYITSDKTFLHQLKQIIATSILTITSRLLSVDISKIIFNNLIPVAIEHAKDWKLMVEKSIKKGGKPEDYIIDCIGNKIHPAAYSRQSEINYLKKLVTTILPYVLSSTYISTNTKVILREILANWILLPAIDALADPNNINFLIELCTKYEGTLTNEIDDINVPLLDSWIQKISKNNKLTNNTLKPSLDDILNNPQLLYLFMRHIKDKGLVNLLQFCLDIDDLSKRMLNPEITPEIEEILFIDAKNIYNMYLNKDGIEYINLPNNISDDIKKILDGGVNKIQELRTSSSFYQAHQEAHGLLENLCLLSFNNSYELYEYICGSTISINSTITTNQNSTNSSGVGTRLGNQLGKIRGVLRSSAIDGSTYESQNVYQAEEVDCTPRTYNDNNLNNDNNKINYDLTTWRITIPHVDTSDVYPLYIISIYNTCDNKSWTVLRCDNDFYNLRGRLIEFHGDKELNDTLLPSRKNQNISLTTNRQIYQDFIQNLLCKLTLKNSELLYIFLTVDNIKPYLTNYNTTDIGIIYQNVAHKLRKEKGQNLDKFMNTFLLSVINNNNNNKYEQHTDVGVDLTNDEQLNEYNKNAKINNKFYKEPFDNNLNIKQQLINNDVFDKQQVTGACFCIAEIIESLINIPESLSKIIWLIAYLNRSKFDLFFNKYLDDTFVKLLSGGRAAIVIELLEKSIFNNNNSINNQTSYIKDEKCYNNAKEGLYNLLPWWTFGLFDNYWKKIMISLIEPLQCPTLNKHLAYVLVDQVIAKIFPEILQKNFDH